MYWGFRVRNLGGRLGWVKLGLVGDVGFYGLGHLGADFKDFGFGSIDAVGGLVFSFHYGEGFHDVIHIVLFYAVEMEIGGIESQRSRKRPSSSHTKSEPA